jgi:hypothetical protein
MCRKGLVTWYSLCCYLADESTLSVLRERSFVANSESALRRRLRRHHSSIVQSSRTGWTLDLQRRIPCYHGPSPSDIKGFVAMYFSHWIMMCSSTHTASQYIPIDFFISAASWCYILAHAEVWRYFDMAEASTHPQVSIGAPSRTSQVYIWSDTSTPNHQYQYEADFDCMNARDIVL